MLMLRTWKPRTVSLALVLLASCALAETASLPDDRPEGFGAVAKGGTGGRVITVATLADSGPGSLREALAASGPRIIQFAVEGTIELQSRLRVTNGQVTLDGSTAPGKGITLRNHGIQFRGDCDDIIVRHLRIRVTTGGAEGDALLFWGNEGGTVERALVDHCSLMGATDEVVNTWGQVRDLTFQWTIIAEGKPPHSKGWLSGVGSDRVSIHHCLFADNADRNPKLEGGVYDVVNNVIYNWDNNNAAKIATGARANLVNNCFIAGPQSLPSKGCIFPADADKGTKVYVAGNVGPLTPTGAENPWLNVTAYDQVGGRWIERQPAPDVFRADKPFPAVPIAAQSAKEAYEAVLTRAGAKVRDTDDLRVVEAVRNRTANVGRSQTPASATSQRTAKFTLMALGDNKLADLDRLAHRYDLMIASADVQPDVIKEFRRRNPGALVFCYINTSDINADNVKYPYFARIWNDTNPHEDWFHHDARGERVRIYYPKYKNRCAFNTGNPGLQQYLAGLVVETLKSGYYDGIQMDNVSTEFPFGNQLIGKWISAAPVRLTPEQWTADEVALLRVIRKAVSDAGLAGKKIIFNHMRSGEPNESRAYVQETDGANCENWMSLRTEPEGRWGWKAKIAQVREVNRMGKITNLLCQPTQMSEDEALFCFASYLMARDGDQAYFFYAPGYKMAQQTAWFPFYDVDLGPPKGDGVEKDGAFLRVFAKGCVVVNPTPRALTIALPGRYRTVAGGEIATLPLAPKRAAVLPAIQNK